MEDDNPRQFNRVSVDLVISQMPSLIGPELQCLKSPTYSISGSWAHTTFSRRFRTILSQGNFGGS